MKIQSMESKNNNRCMFIGLPNSGKSSFIGALWHVVETGEIESAYTITVQPEDREYLNELRSNFLVCKAPERTKTDFVKKIELNVQDKLKGISADFIFPDLSGETYVSQFEHRKLATKYIEEIRECNCIMLFINPDFIKKGNLISYADRMVFNGSDDHTVIEMDSTRTNLGTEITWNAKMCQTQVMLVDLLQIISSRIVQPCKIGVVISAWDLILNIPEEVEPLKNPKEWLKCHLPLLNQYLAANKLKFTYQVFGISAQGAKYEEDGENFELLSYLKQSERIKVQVNDDLSNDITIPIKWLING